MQEYLACMKAKDNAREQSGHPDQAVCYKDQDYFVLPLTEAREAEARMARLLEKITDNAIAKFAENVVEMAESLEMALPAPQAARQPVVAAPAH